MLADEEAWIPPSRLSAFGAAVNRHCDARDGIEDGIFMNPPACDFEPRQLQCPAGVDNDTRPLLCDWVELAYRITTTQTGPKKRTIRN